MSSGDAEKIRIAGTASRVRAWPTSVHLRDGAGGLPSVVVNGKGGVGEIVLNGAHLTSWQPVGERPVLWMSSANRFVAGQPIRGGVPVCFPWFGRRSDHPDAPQHGFARLCEWAPGDVLEDGDRVSVTFHLTDTEATRSSSWPHRFEAEYAVTIGSELQLSLQIWNRDDIPISFEAALHNYYAVGDVRTTRITGLERADFYAEGMSRIQQENTPVQADGGMSRRYLKANTATIEDTRNNRIISVASEGSHGMIVWNPGAATAATMDDFADEEWPSMLCLETCSIDDAAVGLAPGEFFTMSVRVAVTPLATPA